MTFKQAIIHELLRWKLRIEQYKPGNKPEAKSASKRNYARWNKTALGPRGQAETSIKIEDLRSNKTTGKLSLMLISCAAECPDNIYFIQSSDKHNQLM
jgi:hypothetical protein